MQYYFDDLVFDTARQELRRGALVLPLQPRATALLHVLIENRDRIVRKRELIDRVWSGRIVTDAAVAVVVHHLRRTFGVAGPDRRFIRTHYGLGFRFVAEVAEGVPVPARAASGASPPSLAVLPLRPVGLPASHEVLAEAIPDDVITELSRLRWLVVFARGSTFRFLSYEIPVEEIGRLLRVRYCLSGSIEAVGQKVILTIELADTDGARVVWRDRMSSTLGGIHGMRQDIARRVAAALDREIPAHEIARAEGQHLLHRGVSPEARRRAGEGAGAA